MTIKLSNSMLYEVPDTIEMNKLRGQKCKHQSVGFVLIVEIAVDNVL